MVVSPSQPGPNPRYWPSARYFTEAIQCPSVCFAHPLLRTTLPAVDRLGMPLVTSGQFAYVYKLKSTNGSGDFAVRCFRGYLGDRDQRYRVIQEHLKGASVSYLSHFSYAPEGILVGGNRFPILFMNWIDGPTLDLYIRDMLHRPEVLLHLSEEWLRLLTALRASGIAHGDLQHGNIIVEHGQLRLVDHDGMFVTRMAGWTASEVGHQHYQHPRRDARHFDANLDSFSSIVIYLSLLALAERPALWQEHHDENLLFTKSDFIDPASSSLFAKIRELGPEHRRLADVLASAASAEPADVPCLLDLVKTKSSLPAWMAAPMNLEATTKTREVISMERPADRRNVRWIPWQERSRETPLPATPSSTMLTSIFNAGTSPPTPSVRDPNNVWGNTIFYSREFLRKYYLPWYWAVLVLLHFLGINFVFGVFVSLVCLTVGCLTYGFVRAFDEALKAGTSKVVSGAQQPSIAATPPPPQSFSRSWNPHVNLPVSSFHTTVSQPFVGNLVLGIYHAGDCDWVGLISTKNRVNFSTASEAISHGFKPCQVCSPAA